MKRKERHRKEPGNVRAKRPKGSSRKRTPRKRENHETAKDTKKEAEAEAKLGNEE
jgi:hypothetical protein